MFKLRVMQQQADIESVCDLCSKFGFEYLKPIIKTERSKPKDFLPGLCAALSRTITDEQSRAQYDKTFSDRVHGVNGAIKSIADLLDDDGAKRFVGDLVKCSDGSWFERILRADDTYDKLVKALAFMCNFLETKIKETDDATVKMNLKTQLDEINIVFSDVDGRNRQAKRELEEKKEEQRLLEQERKRAAELERLRSEKEEAEKGKEEVLKELAVMREQIQLLMKNQAGNTAAAKRKIPSEHEDTQILDWSPAPLTFSSVLSGPQDKKQRAIQKQTEVSPGPAKSITPSGTVKSAKSQTSPVAKPPTPAVAKQARPVAKPSTPAAAKTPPAVAKPPLVAAKPTPAAATPVRAADPRVGAGPTPEDETQVDW